MKTGTIFFGNIVALKSLIDNFPNDHCHVIYTLAHLGETLADVAFRSSSFAAIDVLFHLFEVVGLFNQKVLTGA
jgi:hypothetical protein